MLGASKDVTGCEHQSLLVLHCGTCSLPQNRILHCGTKRVRHQGNEVYLSNKGWQGYQY